jgi:predicted nucleotidyltransferase
VFAYLYGSFVESPQGRDIDIAVYAREDEDPFGLSADLKIALHKATGLPPDIFDVRIINDLEKQADPFGLLYLKNVLHKDGLLVDKDPSARADFLERYGTRYRECEGFIAEVVG